MDSPFQFGTLATDKNFTDRVKERAELKQMLCSGINVALISPRRWGKSSLVKKATDEIATERKEYRICLLDAFSMNSEAEFYSAFASGIIACATGKLERALKDATRYLGGLIPGITLGDNASGALTINLQYTPREQDKLEILNLPEKLAIDKGLHIIVCVDEFQELVKLKEYPDMEGKMRSVWQKQQRVSYCFYGSKKHMMLKVFNDSQKPFYRFANIVFMPKIRKEDWIPFIVGKFESTGKRISKEDAAQICDWVDCHSWYLQQLCYFIWVSTEKEVDNQILTTSLRRLVDVNAPMFMSDVEKLTPSQREMLRAIAAGEQNLYAENVRSRFHLGNPNTIKRNKEILQEKSFIDSDEGTLSIADPVFKIWYDKRHVSIYLPSGT